MTNDDKAYIDRLLNFDSLAQAEDFTGLSYKDDETTMALGMLMHIENGQRKRDALQAANDTHWGIKFLDAVDIFLDLGFEPIYAQIKPDNREYGKGQPVHYNAYWRGGILLIMESHEDSLNKANIYFNWRRHDGQTQWPDWDLGLSGGWERHTGGYDGILADDPWTLVVSTDMREGARRKLERIESLDGFILPEWAFQPFLHFVSYVEERAEADDYEGSRKLYLAQTAEKIAQFDPRVRDIILGASKR